jgi:hypothetical protein
MYTKFAVITIYLATIYWLSKHIPLLEPLFYPTLGAISYLLVSRTMTGKESASILAGAVAASVAGSALHAWLPGTFSFLATFVFGLFLIRKFRLNAPPILAIALIPFFEPPATPWTVPLAVFLTLSTLLLCLLLVERASALWTAVAGAYRGRRRQEGAIRVE